jgi:hypothetical protein
VTLGADGTVRAVEQLVNEPYFARLRPGMTRAEVEQILGRPSQIEDHPMLNEEVVSWNYIGFISNLMQFNAHFDRSGHLVNTSRTPDPIDAFHGKDDE